MDQSQHIESKEGLQQRMNEVRYSMAETVGEIRHEVAEGFNWETYVQRYPGICLLVAGGVGWAIGCRLAELREPNTSNRDFAGPGNFTASESAGEPSSATRMAEVIASSVFAGLFPLLAEKFKQFFGETSPV
jgi:hypothetical protein